MNFIFNYWINMKIFVLITCLIVELNFASASIFSRYTRFTGDWGGARTYLSEKGFDVK